MRYNPPRTRNLYDTASDKPFKVSRSRIDLFIRLCLQNRGRLSPGKRRSHFDMLSDDEVSRLEQAVIGAYGTEASDRFGLGGDRSAR